MDVIAPYSNYLIGGAVALGALIIVWLLAKALGRSVTGRKGNRLSVSEYHEIDKSRRLVLVKRDNVEHLVLIGGNQDLVVESGIGSGVSRSSEDDMPRLDRHQPDKYARAVAEDNETFDIDPEDPPPHFPQPAPAAPQPPPPAPLAARPAPRPAVFGDNPPPLRPATPGTEPRFAPANPNYDDDRNY